MNIEQEQIQFLGFFGILKESYKVIVSCRKIFTKTFITLLIPLSFIFLAHLQIQDHFFPEIAHKLLSLELAYFILFKVGFFIFFITLALISTSAQVYTVASVYAGKDLTFKKVLTVVPTIWKRLMLTFIWSLAVVFLYTLVFLGFIFLIVGNVISSVLFTLLYVIGFVYATLIWHLASIVSVMEESYGLAAMSKSQVLIKGKICVSVAYFALIGLILIGIQIMFEYFVVGGEEFGSKIGFGIICLILMAIWMLFGLAAQMVIYFVCKSYHHENIDKSLLSDRLEGYYVPLKNKDA